MSDRILLTGMAFFGRHGVLPAEQTLGARFVVDVELYTDLQAAGARDDLAATVDYSAVYRRVRAVIEGPPLHLIEAVAERIAAVLLADFPQVARVVVRVHKPQAPIAGAVAVSAAVEIDRTRPANPTEGLA
ncbi:MAG: dihydroneopterin aldolase [Chloroflexi bacterium]|nr:dihydroneopterin aldolase [Chloroflexota bacterium]